MKLLIDIPEHIYEHAKETTEDSRDEFDAMRAIANGSQQESRSEIPNTCDDAVSKEQLIRELNAQMAVGAITREIALDMLNHLPSVTPQQKTGRWKFTVYDANRIGHYECSECHWNVLMNVSDYCPHCGAKMEVDS